MSTPPIKQLSDLLASLVSDAEEIRRHLLFAQLEAIADEIPSRASKTEIVASTSERLLKHGSAELLLTHFLELSEFKARHYDILRVASNLGLKLAHRARAPYLEAVVAAATDRQTLAGLRGPAVPLASVYVDPILQSPSEPDFCGRTLTEWLRTARAGQAILILGEPGAGKTELLLHSAAEFARAALEEPAAALPLLVTATELVRAGSLAAALSTRWRESQDGIDILLHSPTTRLYLFIDALDEAPQRKLLELLDVERRALTSRLDALVLTSRPAFLPTLRDCIRLHLNAWDQERAEHFLVKWAAQDADSITALRAHLHEPHVRELLANPLTATLCILAARRHPKALRRRSMLLRAVFDDVLQWWPTHRSADVPELDPYWLRVAPILRDLASIALREGRPELERDDLIARLRGLAGDEGAALLDWIERGIGVLAPVGDDAVYRFTDRRLMEYLAASKLVETPQQLLHVAQQPWAQEPARIAFGLLHAADPEQASQLLHELLATEAEDVPGLSDRSLRLLLVAIDVAADEPELPAPLADLIAKAVVRRLLEEYSNWVGDVVATRARRLARSGGSVWTRLEPLLVELLTNNELRRPFHAATVLPLLDDLPSAMRALVHRNLEVGIAGCHRLVDYINIPEIQVRLFEMLFSHGLASSGPLALAAGWALRHASRSPSFTPLLTALQSLLDKGAQPLRCAAALALHPGEAPAASLVAALGYALQRRSEIPLQVFEDIFATSDGRESLGKIIPNWREWHARSTRPQHEPEPQPLRLPCSNTCRSRIFEVLAGSAIPLSTLNDVLSVEENLHSYTESFDLLSPTAVFSLLARVRETGYALCAVAQQKLGVIALADPNLANYVLDWWESIDRTNPALLASFPGRALEPLVLAGNSRAIEAYAVWLPESEHIHSHALAHHGSKIPRAVLAVPHIRDAARSASFRRSESTLEFNPTAIKQLSNAWEDEPAILEPFEFTIKLEHEAWLRTDDPTVREYMWVVRHSFVSCPDVDFPTSARSILAKIFHDVVHSERHGEGGQNDIKWHFFVAHVIRFAVDSDFGLEIASDLRFLAGDGQTAPCVQLGLHAACATWDSLPVQELERLSAFWSSNFSHTDHLDLIQHSSFAKVVRTAPDLWAQCLRSLMGAHTTNVVYPTHALILFECLPTHYQRSMAIELLAIADRSPSPWIRRRREESRLVRLADEIRRIAFETQVI